MKYRVCVLYSGSAGNATLIETPSVSFLIDAGKNVRSLSTALKAVGSDLSRIGAVFVTHEHRDHIGALEVLCGKYQIPIHMTAPSAGRILESPDSRVTPCLVVHDGPYAVQVGDATVIAFPVPHDSRACVGYRIFLRQGDESCNIGYATDVGFVSEDVQKGLFGCETVVLESNHDEEMLVTGPYPYDLKVRIRGRGGHLSNTDSAALSGYLAEHGLKRLILAHLSQENNTPELVYDEHRSALAGTSVQIAVASQDCVTEFAVEDA